MPALISALKNEHTKRILRHQDQAAGHAARYDCALPDAGAGGRRRVRSVYLASLPPAYPIRRSLRPWCGAAPPGSPRRPRPAEPLCPCPVAGRPGQRARARRPRWWGYGPPPAPGRRRAAPPPPGVAPRRAAKTLAEPGPGRWPGCPPGPLPCPLPLAASRQRFSTGNRSPVAAVIGVSSWPAACRKISSIWVARAAQAETNAA